MLIGIFFSKYEVILRMFSIIYIKAVNTIGMLLFYCSCFNAFDIVLFGSGFYSLFLPWGRITMIFRGVDILNVVVNFDGFATLRISVGAGFYRFMGPLRGVLFILDF